MDYLKLVEVYEELGKTTKKLEKRDILAKFFKSLPNFDEAVLLVQGRVFSARDERKIGMSSKLVIRAIALSCGVDRSEVENLFKKKGDLGDVAFDLISKKKQRTLVSNHLSVEKVFSNIVKLATLEGAGTVDKKIKLVAELLTSAKPIEAKYIVKTLVEEMRVGVASGIVRDSIAKAFDCDAKDVEKAFNVIGNYAKVALLAKNKTLGKASLSVGSPVKVMLAVLVKNISEAFKAVGSPALFEYKMDGFRIQVHRKGSAVKLFTRRMDEVTKQFPDIVENVKKHVHGDDYVIDCEAVGFDCKTGRYLPFQKISQRIKRKHNIERMSNEFPVELNVFDVLFLKGKSFMGVEQRERRKILSKMIKGKKKKVVLTKSLITSDEKKALKFFKKAIKDGLEGVIVKNLNSVYNPGRYVAGWVKLKEMLEPLDLIIVGAEYGHGKRAGVLSSFILACCSGNKFLECGKMGTGIKELKGEGITFSELTKLLKPLIISEDKEGVRIKPKIVVEVGYEEIQKSSKYGSGYALRFPRLLRMRTDEKKVSDANTLRDLKRIYKIQKGK